MNTTRNILFILLLIGLFTAGYHTGRKSVEVKTVERIRIDTIFYEKPKPFTASVKYVTANIPHILFMPSDTVRESVIVKVRPDSSEMRLAMERKEYRDSTYFAVVSGPAIGDYHPQLDWIETYNTTRTRTHVSSKVKRWGIGVTTGYGCFAVDGTIKSGPTLSIGVSYHIFSW